MIEIFLPPLPQKSFLLILTASELGLFQGGDMSKEEREEDKRMYIHKGD